MHGMHSSFLGGKQFFFAQNCHFLEKKNLYIFFIFLQCLDEIIAIHFFQGFSAIFTICLMEIFFMERSWLRLLAYGKVVMIGQVPCHDCLNLPTEPPVTQYTCQYTQVQPTTSQYTCPLHAQCHKQRRGNVHVSFIEDHLFWMTTQQHFGCTPKQKGSHTTH